MKFDRLSSQDRAHLVNAVASLFQREGANAAEALLVRVSQQGRRLLRKLHAEEIVNEAVQLWINSARSRSSRAMRGALAGVFLPRYRADAAKKIEEALRGTKPRPKVIDVEAEVR